MIPKSRYDTIDCYLASAEYNDQEVLYDSDVFKLLREEGLDDLMAQHIAHLFIRDPISLFAEKLEQDVETETDHFEVSMQHIALTRVNPLWKIIPPPPRPPQKWLLAHLMTALALVLGTHVLNYP